MGNNLSDNSVRDKHGYKKTTVWQEQRERSGARQQGEMFGSS